MEALTLDKALELHGILEQHLPDALDEDALEFVGKIVNNIKESGQHKDYVDAVILMSGKEWEEIKSLKFEEILELFIRGLSANKIVQLKSFCEEVGFTDAR